MSARKRVAIYVPNLLPLSETFIREQAKALSKWDPILVGQQRVENGLDLADLPAEIIPLSGGRWVRRLRYLLQRADPRILQRLKALDVSLVHAHFGTEAVRIWPTVKAAGLPMLVTLHGYDINIHKWWWEAGHRGFGQRLYPRRLLRMAQDPSVRFIAVSQAIKRRAIKEYGIPEDRITVSYIGVDTVCFKPGGLSIEQRRKRILFVGRMVENKGPLLLIRAFADVLKQVPNAELVMIGGGPLLRNAKRLAQSLGVPVQFLGARYSDEVITQLHQARVLCLPSMTITNGESEGFPIVILEAQACGVPVVTSARGGAQEGILHGKSGFAFDEGSTQGMIEGLLSFLEDDTAALTASTEATRFVKRAFDLRACTRKLEMAYDKLTAGER